MANSSCCCRLCEDEGPYCHCKWSRAMEISWNTVPQILVMKNLFTFAWYCRNPLPCSNVPHLNPAIRGHANLGGLWLTWCQLQGWGEHVHWNRNHGFIAVNQPTWCSGTMHIVDWRIRISNTYLVQNLQTTFHNPFKFNEWRVQMYAMWFSPLLCCTTIMNSVFIHYIVSITVHGWLESTYLHISFCISL